MNRYGIIMLNQWILDALKNAGLSQSELARELEKRLRRTYDRSVVTRIIKNQRKISADELLAIEKITGVSAPNNETHVMVPLLGQVHAGTHVTIQDTAQGPFDEVIGPPNATGTTVAAEINGDCFGKTFNGWNIFWNDPPSPPGAEHMNALCVVWLDDGRILVKRISRGTLPGVFKLESEFEPPLYDQIVKLAAPVIAMMPR